MGHCNVCKPMTKGDTLMCDPPIAKVKNYNLNVTEVRYPAFPMLFSGIFNFTVGILVCVKSYASQKDIKRRFGVYQSRRRIRLFSIFLRRVGGPN